MRTHRRTGEPSLSPRPKAVELGRQSELAPRRFDPETEISDTDWEEMKAELESVRGSDWEKFCHLAYSCTLLFPDRRNELNLDDASWQGMVGWLAFENQSKRPKDSPFHESPWRYVGHISTRLLFLFPERRAALQLDDQAWSGLTAQLEAKRKLKRGDFWSLATSLVILFPDRRAEVGLDESVWTALRSELDDKRESDWNDFSYYARIARILFPAHDAELNLNAGAWVGMKAALETDRKTGIADFAGVAADLAILSADEILITEERGLELINHPRAESAEPLPPRQAA